MTPPEILAYYSRPDVQQAMLAASRNREVVGVFPSNAYASRPGTLLYPADIISLVRTGVVEFHCSVERWSQPSAIRQDNYQSLRTGFDIILDLDCETFEHGKTAALIIAAALRQLDLKHFSVKFTGNTGFHIGIPWESFPKAINYKPTVELFPSIGRSIIAYLKAIVRDPLEGALLKTGTPEQLAAAAGKPLGQLFEQDRFNPFAVVDIDAMLMSPRHLYRMPFSLHKKTFLISLPIPWKELGHFAPGMADPEVAVLRQPYLPVPEAGEAESLFAEALDWQAKRQVKAEPAPEAKKATFSRKIPVELFPPCMKAILDGLADGKKRSLFVLTNFLRAVKWEWEEIEPFLLEWNQKNRPPLPENTVRMHVRYAQRRPTAPPPNCTAAAWYLSMNVCAPDHVCVSRESIRNPVKYPFRILQRHEEQTKSLRPRGWKQPPRKPIREPKVEREEEE